MNLFDAAWEDNTKALDEMLSAGQDVNELFDGDSALYAAVENSCLSSMNLLLERGADTEIEMRGWSPLRWAVESEFCAGTENLWPLQGNDYRRPIPSVSGLLLFFGADPFRVDSEGQNAYEYARSRGHKSFVALVDGRVGPACAEEVVPPKSDRAGG